MWNLEPFKYGTLGNLNLYVELWNSGTFVKPGSFSVWNLSVEPCKTRTFTWNLGDVEPFKSGGFTRNFEEPGSRFSAAAQTTPGLYFPTA